MSLFLLYFNLRNLSYLIPAGHPCPASSDKTARPFYDRTARPRQEIANEEVAEVYREAGYIS